MLQRPSLCRGCPLDDKATGFAPPEGDPAAPILLLGEALGADEARRGQPFVGVAGAMLARLLQMLGWDRSQFRIANVVSCQPPGDWLEGAPWQYSAIQHCAVHRDPVLAEPHQVVVPLGGVALKTVLGLLGSKKVRVQDFHGTVQRDPSDRYWVVPTFHPSYLQRGAHNLIGTALWDLRQAAALVDRPPLPDEASLAVDPPVDWFAAWVDEVVAARTQDPEAYPISSDVETPDKAHGQDEGEITAEDRSYVITRINVACHPDEGVTVPFQGPYIDLLRRLHQSPGPIWEWNSSYDIPRQIAAGVLTEADHHRVIDLMWLWHVLQSDLPRGLGFVAPFYSRFGAWKHLADEAPAWYGAVDGLQTHRVGFGLYRDLHAQGLFPQAMRHTHRLHHLALQPAQVVGVGISRPALLHFKAELSAKASFLLDHLQQISPPEVLPLTPKDGLTRRPLGLHAKATATTRRGTTRKGKVSAEEKLELYQRAAILERLVLKEVWVCQTCGSVDVAVKHRCHERYVGKGGKERERIAIGLVPSLTREVASVTRWFWQEPFNPDSPKQVLAYLHARGYPAGRAKKTGKDTTNRETLEHLEQTTEDPFFRSLLDYRAVIKVKGTYVEGTERRLDEHDRVHPVPTFKPSTQRLSYIDPNITNVVADKGGEETLAAGFRRCVVAGTQPPPWWDTLSPEEQAKYA